MLSKKYCPDCQEDRPRSEFYPDRTRPGGLQAYCKKHQTERQRVYQRTYLKEYFKKNPLKRVERTLKQKARQAKVPVEYLLLLLGDPCAYCGGKSEHIDHVTPVVVGGSSNFTNLVGACSNCNREKGKKSLLFFLGSRL